MIVTTMTRMMILIIRIITVFNYKNDDSENDDKNNDVDYKNNNGVNYKNDDSDNDDKNNDVNYKNNNGV